MKVEWKIFANILGNEIIDGKRKVKLKIFTQELLACLLG